MSKKHEELGRGVGGGLLVTQKARLAKSPSPLLSQCGAAVVVSGRANELFQPSGDGCVLGNIGSNRCLSALLDD